MARPIPAALSRSLGGLPRSLERLRLHRRRVALVSLGAVACVVVSVTLGSRLLERHPSPWFPSLYTALPPAAAAAPGPGIYLQMPVIQQALPLDCEVAALQAALASKGVRVTQLQIFAKVPRDTRSPVIGADGLPAQWGDPYRAFVGDAYGEEGNFTGYGVYYPPIAAAATQFGVLATGHTGWTVSAIEDQIRLGNPVVVWVDSSFRVRQLRHWRGWDGTDVGYDIGEHAVAVMGFDPKAGTITVVDVLRGQLHTFPTHEFALVLTTFGGMGVAFASLPAIHS
jgi:uncharacterized protein YvpB